MKNKNDSDQINKGEKKTFKTVLAGAVALLFCPCHIVLFLPLLAGTALGTVLSQYTGVLTAVFAVLFGLSLWYLMRSLGTKENG
jgi:mercuric ion transport protein